METDPGEPIVQDEPRGCGLLGEVRLADAVALELVKVEAVLSQHLDRLWCASFRVNVPLEVELPSRDRAWLATFLVEERDSELDNFHLVD